MAVGSQSGDAMVPRTTSTHVVKEKPIRTAFFRTSVLCMTAIAAAACAEMRVLPEPSFPVAVEQQREPKAPFPKLFTHPPKATFNTQSAPRSLLVSRRAERGASATPDDVLAFY